MIGCVFASIPFIIDCLQDENSNNQAYDIQVANVQCSHYSLFSCQSSMLSDGTLIVITISALIPLSMVWAVNIWLYVRKGSFYSLHRRLWQIRKFSVEFAHSSDQPKTLTV